MSVQGYAFCVNKQHVCLTDGKKQGSWSTCKAPAFPAGASVGAAHLWLHNPLSTKQEACAANAVDAAYAANAANVANAANAANVANAASPNQKMPDDTANATATPR